MGILEGLLNPGLVAAIILLLEFAKIYLPDSIEPKVLPILAVVIGIGASFIFPAISILAGFASGIAAASGYKIAKDSLKTLSQK